MTKKEFKKKCKEEKALCSKLMLSGGICAVLGLVIVMATMFLVEGFLPQITGYIIGAVVAVVGMALDIAGEVMLAKAYKAYQDK